MALRAHAAATPSPAFRAIAAPRTVASEVFEQLALAIVRGEFPANSQLPSERVLAEQFGASRVVIRPAIHRLADMGLVRVRKGGATVVCGVDESTDLRVLELLYRHDASDRARTERDMIEKQYYQGVALLDAADARATDAQRAAIQHLAETFAQATGGEREITEFERQFWLAVADAGGNRILRIEVAWWYRLFAERHPRPAAVRDATFAIRVGFYRMLAHRLTIRDDVTGYYLSVIRTILAASSTPAPAIVPTP